MSDDRLDLMVLVVDRSSRRVLDCQALDYSWRLDEIVERHDLENKVDLVMRPRTKTRPTAVAESFVNTDIEQPAPITEDESIPF